MGIERKELEDRVVKILGNYVDITDSGFGMDTSLDELGLDSFTAIYLLLDLEEEFQIQIPDIMLAPEIFVSPCSLTDAVQKVLEQ